MAPEDAINALVEGKIGVPIGDRDKTNQRIARDDISDALPAAVQSLLSLAMHSKNERVRLDSSKYIIERGLGPVSKANGRGDSDPIQDLVDEILEK